MVNIAQWKRLQKIHHESNYNIEHHKWKRKTLSFLSKSIGEFEVKTLIKLIKPTFRTLT
jgi:hypothetical protein